jgi:hypothetical protein
VDHQQSVKYKSTIIKTWLCARTHSNFFQGHIDRGLFYWPNHSKNSAVQLRRTLAFKRGIWPECPLYCSQYTSIVQWSWQHKSERFFVKLFEHSLLSLLALRDSEIHGWSS